MTLKSIRRENLRTLAKSIGGISRLADRLNKNQSQVSHLIGRNPIKNIGDKIAAEAEAAFKKSPGWLDHKHHAPEEELSSYYIEQHGQVGILCSRVPLISWEEAREWDHIAYKYKPKSGLEMIPTATKLGPLAFALKVYGDSMESPTGISFPANSIIIVDPDAIATPNSFVVVRLSKDRGATLKQLVDQGHKRCLKPLNRRYPILELTPNAIILGVVKQMIINFNPAQNITQATTARIRHVEKVDVV